MIVSATGHRPDKIGGYNSRHDLRNFARRVLEPMHPDGVVVGMALGWDTAVCEAAMDLSLPVTAAIPFVGQESMWPGRSQDLYRTLLQRCDKIVIVSPGGYENHKMQLRNEWMVDNSDIVLALWNGSTGGTANCLRYCRKIDKPFLNVWPLWSY